jgi:hypothetical protein
MKKETAERLISEEPSSKLYQTTVNADTIFNTKGFIVELEWTSEDDYEKLNALLRIRKGDEIVYSDSMFSSMQEFIFTDINLDGERDILVQNISDARSNLTYNLYLVNTEINSFIKVPEFPKIKNPRLSEGIIVSYVVSGTDYSIFYELTKENNIFQHDIVCYDDHTDSSFHAYRYVLDSLKLRRKTYNNR